MIDFLNDESGAVTVDWVVLTAASIGMGVAVTTSVGNGVKDLADRIAADLSNTTLQLPVDPGGGGVAAFSYSALDAANWDTLIAEVREKFTGAAAPEMVDVLSSWVQNDGTVALARQDIYAAVQIVYEEQGYVMPAGLPDMRNFGA